MFTKNRNVLNRYIRYTPSYLLERKKTTNVRTNKM